MVLTDPTSVGTVNRVRLVGAIRRFVPLSASTDQRRLDLDASADVVTERTRAVFVNNASFPTGCVDPLDASARLPEHKVAATPMVGWGDRVAARHVRFVFSNEPVQRLAVLGDRARTALAAARASRLG